MYEFDRRTFLKLFGQSTAALGVGLSLKPGSAFAKKASTTEGTEGKYQTFYPGEYFD